MIDNLRMENLISLLEEESRDVFYVSETDSSLEPFVFENIDELIREADLDAGGDFPGKRERRSATEFFARLTTEKDWHGDFEKRNTAAFQKIERLMTENTKDLQVLRQGYVRIRIYVFGEGVDGKLYGIRMHSVET
jgi:hypothetical protein